MKKESVLWQFNKKGKSKQHYLLGTMHVSSEEAYSSVTMSKRLMDECAQYAGELDLSDPRLGELAALYVNPDGLELMDLVGEKKYKKYAKIIDKSFGIDLDSMTRYKPLIISNMVAESILTQKYELSLDYFLWNYALSSDMQMNGLESFEDQKNILLQIPMDIQLKSFKDMVRNVPKYRKTILQTQELYADGKINKLYKATKKSMGKLRNLMIYDRNELMTKRLIKLTKEGSTFCAVGAGHLPGKKGMLKLLKDNGYKVKPVMF